MSVFVQSAHFYTYILLSISYITNNNYSKYSARIKVSAIADSRFLTQTLIRNPELFMPSAKVTNYLLNLWIPSKLESIDGASRC